MSQTLRTLKGHTNAVNAVAVTADGSRAVSASADQTLRLWDLANGQTIRTFEGHTDWINAVAVTADSRRAISASNDQTLRLWDLKSEAKQSNPRKEAVGARARNAVEDSKWRHRREALGVGRLNRRRYSCTGGRPWVRCKSGASQVATGVV
jgi:WD40 repeat protein